MPNPTLLLQALSAAAILAAALVLVLGWPSRRRWLILASAAAVLGVGSGYYVGIWLLGVRPHWPPREDQDRLLFLLFPVVLIVEVVAVFAGRFRWLAWLPRVAIAALAARILLDNSTYLTDLSGPGTREWSPTESVLILSILAVALAGVWALLALLMRRAPNRSAPLAVAVVCAGAAVAVMLSGYATGGPPALALAAAIVGATVASFALPHPPNLTGVLGLGIVGLFALVVVGRFFGSLTTANAAALLFAPLLCWLPELPYLRNAWAWVRALVRVVVVAAPAMAVLAILVLTQQKPPQDADNPSPGSPQPTRDDYLNFGK
jgi:hypothetical protein